VKNTEDDDEMSKETNISNQVG